MNILLCWKVCGFIQKPLFCGVEFDLLLACKNHRKEEQNQGVPVSGPKPKAHAAQFLTKKKNQNRKLRLAGVSLNMTTLMQRQLL